MGATFHPPVKPLAIVCVIGLVLLVGSYFLWTDGNDYGRAVGIELVGNLIGIAGGIGMAVGLLLAVLAGLPLVQRFIRRRPALELRSDSLVLTLGLGKVHEFRWVDIAGVEARRVKGRRSLGGVIVHLRAGQRSWGREVYVPNFFLDRSVEEIADAMRPLVGRGGNDTPGRRSRRPR